MNLLDARTVLFSYIVSDAICAAVMISLWLQNRRRSAGLGFWLADFILQFAAVLLIALRGLAPELVSILLGIPLVMGGTLLLYIGLERYTGQASSQRHNYLLLAVFISVHAYFTFVHPSLPARNISLSLALLVICSQCAWLLLRRVTADLRPDTRLAGVIFGVYSLVSLVRVFVDGAGPQGNDLFKSGLFDTLVILVYQMLFIGLTFGLFLMVNRRLLAAMDGDIVERKQAEAALKRSEEKFSKAFRNSPDAYVITSMPDGKIIQVNESFFRLVGLTPEEIAGKTTLELNLWKSLEDRDQFLTALQKAGRVLNFETTFRKKTGELRIGWISGEFLQLQEGQCVLTVIYDITERKQAEAALDRERRLLRTVIDNVPDQIFANDRDGLFILNNRSDAQILGMSDPEMLLGKSDWDFYPPALAARFQADDRQVIESGQPLINREEPSLTPEGNPRWVLTTKVPLRDSLGQVIGVVGIAHDITERKRAEEALRAYSNELEERVEAGTRELRDAQEQLIRQEKLAVLGQMSGGIAHELRQPLAVISNAVYYLQAVQPDADPTIREYLDLIAAELQTADHIVTDLLSFAGAQAAEKEPTVLATLVEQALARNPAPPGVAVQVCLPPDLPPVYVDPRQLGQVLNNLITNACQAMPHGGQLTLTAAPAAGFASLAMADTGTGIAPENMPKLFEPLFTTKSKGVGLGLTVTKMLVEANGGAIEVVSETGRGTTFQITLPLEGKPA